MQTMKKNVLVVVLVALMSGGLAYYALFPVGPEGTSVDIRINRHASLKSVALELQNRHVIKWAPALIAYMKAIGSEKHFQAGHFVFSENEGALSAAAKLLHAKPIEKSVSIPEGLTTEQTANIYYTSLKIDTVEFDSLCKDPKFIKKLALDAPTLEGYLFPDTYLFPEEVTCSEIIKRMIGHFKDSMKDIAPADSSTHQKLTLRQYIILASIVEKEAVIESERPRISAVFHNRLNKGISLGADPTVRYIFKKYSGPLRVSELKSQSPYNTRLFAGLPPGPICSPGIASIRAAMYPLQTKELYFVAKWDGSGAHDFSLTNEEHCKKKLAIQRFNENRIKKEKNGKQ